MKEQQIVDDLMEIKSDIEGAKTKKANIDGKIESSLETLNSKFSCNTLEEAYKKRDKLNIEIKTEKEVFFKEVQNLQSDFFEDKE